MDIVGYKSGGHDGTIAYIQDGELVFSIEAEKDSGKRHSLFSDEEVLHVLKRWRCNPHIVCGDSLSFGNKLTDNYMGLSVGTTYAPLHFDSINSEYVSVPHELSHIACAFALSHLSEKQPFYALVWEGYIGRFYKIDPGFTITNLSQNGHVLDHVGVRYALPYHATARSDIYGFEAAGKIMALSGLADISKINREGLQREIDLLIASRLDHKPDRIALNGDWDILYKVFERYRDMPVTDPDFASMCKALQNGIFEVFYQFANTRMNERLPLVISGGCGLNCDWNTMWKDTGLFESVFVPPVTNDSGIAIGAASVIQRKHTGKMKIDWSVYAGEEFIHEAINVTDAGFVEMELNYELLTDWLLEREMIVAWIQGRYEIGPRALCHRSLIAAPFKKETQAELNRIKRREAFRPVAPVCMEEEVSKHFEWSGPSPHMLYFQKVKSKVLKAITHVDGTARVQTVNRDQDPKTHQLLSTVRERSGYGVLCNTSLNFLGRGFINRTSDLLNYVTETCIPAFVVNDKMYLSSKKQKTLAA